MAVVTLLPSASRGNVVTPTFSVPAGAPVKVRLAMTSPVFGSDASLRFEWNAEQSFTAGASWVPWFDSGLAFGGAAGQVIEGVAFDGLVTQMVTTDGRARLMRATITVNTPFTYGVTGEVVP